MRLRFSLTTLIFTATVVALGLGLWKARTRNDLLQRENEQLSAQNANFRDELGILDVADVSQIHAIRVDTRERRLSHRFRVFLPSSQQYVLKYQCNDIPRTGVPQFGSSVELNAGENLIDITLHREHSPRTGEAIAAIRVDIDVVNNDDRSASSITEGIGEKQNDWIVNKETGSFAYGIEQLGQKAKTFQAKERVILLRLRANRVVPLQRNSAGRVTKWSSQEFVDLCDGFMVWLEPLP